MSRTNYVNTMHINIVTHLPLSGARQWRTIATPTMLLALLNIHNLPPSIATPEQNRAEEVVIQSRQSVEWSTSYRKALFSIKLWHYPNTRKLTYHEPRLERQVLLKEHTPQHLKHKISVIILINTSMRLVDVAGLPRIDIICLLNH